ncbi:MAG: heavy-metal-associated domain-containing protein [Oscillospiraceae bacterium]
MAKASAYFDLGDLPDKHDEKAIKRELDALPGVLSVSVSDSSGRVAVDYDTTGVQAGRIEKQLEKLGYQIVDSQADDHTM